MCLLRSQLGSLDCEQLRTAGCSTQELFALGWRQQRTLWLLASQPGGLTPQSLEMQFRLSPGRFVCSGGALGSVDDFEGGIFFYVHFVDGFYDGILGGLLLRCT